MTERLYRKLVYGLMSCSLLLSVVAVTVTMGNDRSPAEGLRASSVQLPSALPARPQPVRSPVTTAQAVPASATLAAAPARPEPAPVAEPSRSAASASATPAPARATGASNVSSSNQASTGGATRQPAVRPASSEAASRPAAPAAPRPAAQRASTSAPARPAASAPAATPAVAAVSSEPIMLDTWQEGAVIGLKTTRRYVLAGENDPRYEVFRKSRNAVFFPSEADAEKARYRKMPSWREGE